MALDEILAGVGGALKGGLDGFTWSKEFEQKDRQMENQKEVARLRDEIRLMIASMTEGGRNARYAAPSGNTVYTQDATTARNDADNTTTAAVADGRNAVTTRGQDLNFTLGGMRDTTTRRGQDITQQLGIDRNATTRRGQDIGATTTRRGQDLNFTLGTTAETGRNTRATDANTLREKEISERAEREKNRNRDPWGVSTTSGVSFGGTPAGGEVKEGTTTKPTAQPIEVKETTGTLPVAPRSPEAAGDQMQRLESQALAAIERFKVEKDPAKKAAIKADLTRLRDEIQKAQTKSGAQ